MRFISDFTRFLEKVERNLTWHIMQEPIVCNKRLVFEVSLGSKVPIVQAKVPIEFVLLTMNDVNLTTSLDANPQEVNIVGAIGDLTFKGIVDEKEVFHMKISFSKNDMANLIPYGLVPDKAVFIYDCYTDPKYRGQSIYPAALAQLSTCLRREGFDKIFLRTHPRNSSSIEGALKAGFRLCGAMYHPSFFGFPLKPVGRAFGTKRAKK